MPELPEVETVCQGLKKPLNGAVVKELILRRPDLRTPFPEGLKDTVEGQTIRRINRRAKYILIEMTENVTLILHLGMSGRITVLDDKPDEYGKHDHFVLVTEDNRYMIFNDARRFGMVGLCETPSVDKHKFFVHLGADPLSNDFSPAYLDEKLRGKKVAIKNALLNQKIVTGIGNIYASEALYESNIDPTRPAGELNKGEINRLVGAIRLVLDKAIRAGGSTLRDYIQTTGEMGYFQNQWSVYNKRGQACPDCTCDVIMTGGIQKIKQGGRSTFYCPTRQN